jgi:WD40 repeat protein
MCVFSFITGSYDRTCKVWGGESGEELVTLEGHKNVVYTVAFNNPYGCGMQRPAAAIIHFVVIRARLSA